MDEKTPTPVKKEDVDDYIFHKEEQVAVSQR